MKALFLFLFVILFLQINTTAQVYNGDLTLTSQAEVDDFHYTEVTGNLSIDEAVAVNITNLDSLSELTTIGGTLFIFNNNSLTNVNGLFNLTSVGGFLHIYNNNALTNIDALSNLTSVGGDLFIRSNAALTNIDSLSSLSSVGADLLIESNAALTNVNGLSNLDSVGGSLGIFYNDALANIDGLSNLSSVGNLFNIQVNAALTNINGLSNLTSIGGTLVIYNNNALTNIDGLSSLTSVGGDLGITNNIALVEFGFCGLYALLSPVPDGLVGTYTVSGNGGPDPDPTEQQIIDGGPCATIIPGTLTAYPLTINDDGYILNSSPNTYRTSQFSNMGNISGGYRNAIIRFPNVGILDGKIIDSAFVYLT